MLRFICSIALWFGLSLTACAADEGAGFSGQWVNDRGSAVTFTVTDGLLSGYYQTALGSPDKATQFSLTGFVEGDQITFTVNFKGHGSLTSWTGQMTRDSGGDYIRTLWHLTRDIDDADEDDDLWRSITAGASDFRRVEPSAD